MSLFQRLLCLASYLSSIPDGPAKTEGIALGIEAGNTILALRSNPVPEYPSGHSTLGNAAATVLTYFFGNSPFSTTSTTTSPAGAIRSFKS
jgi:hypothetical protein